MLFFYETENMAATILELTCTQISIRALFSTHTHIFTNTIIECLKIRFRFYNYYFLKRFHK